jgi:uncharacterized protein (DUF488 family)
MEKRAPVAPSRGASPRLITVGHGAVSADELAQLLEGAGVKALVDVRSIPGSRRHPQFGRLELERRLSPAGISYRWEPDLGGFRRSRAGSPNVGLRHPSFRGYADYMASRPFERALTRLLEEASSQVTAVMCAETLWWRCHRRLIADAVVLVKDAEVSHLDHRGHVVPHRPTEGVRLDGHRLVYDGTSSTESDQASAVTGRPAT